MTRILLADDDQVLSDLLTEFLSGQQLNVSQVFDGGSAVERALNGNHDLIILDVMMPVKDGFQVLREVRKSSVVPILMLTARGEDVDRIVGLEMGADDYLPKPCNPRELLARINAILRRVDVSAKPQAAETLRVSDLHLNTADRSANVAGTTLDLTVAEFNMLEALMRNPGTVISKEELTEKGLSRKLELYDRSVDMHISNLRKKLGRDGSGEQRIRTIRGIGYLLSTDVAEQRAVR